MKRLVGRGVAQLQMHAESGTAWRSGTRRVYAVYAGSEPLFERSMV
jgi:hypothetical protein